MSRTKKTRRKSSSNCIVMHKKKVRSKRGIPETNYGEVKKIFSFSLTPQAHILLRNLSQELNISASELLERFARSGADLKTYLKQEASLAKADEAPSEGFNKP